MFSGKLYLAMLTVVVVGLCFGTGAAAAAPDLLLRIPDSEVQPGNGAGQLRNPRAIAGDKATGHIYVSELENSRISEYTAWGLFVKAWGWGVADGSAELQACGPVDPESAPDPSLCQAGLTGEGRGQMSSPLGLAVDPAGDVYVHELGNLRIQKFSPDGEFLLMFGGDVNKTKVAAAAPQSQRDVCPIDPGDVCGTGTSGAGPSQLASTVQDFIAYSSALDAIVVGGEDRIQIFNLDGTFREQIDFEDSLAAFDQRTVSALDTDSAGNLYVAISGLPNVHKLSPSGEPLPPGEPGDSSFAVTDPLAVAVDAEGNLYAVETGSLAFVGRYIVGFDAGGSRLDGMEPADEFGRVETDAFPEFGGPFSEDLSALATNRCPGSTGSNLFAARANLLFEERARSYVSVYGPPPTGCEPPPVRPPDILDQYASAVGTDWATVKAEINPRFWADTTYFVEYGTGRCIEGGCDQTEPLPPGASLTKRVVSAGLTTPGVLLRGLAPDTTYHYRFVAQSSGGGPTVGEEGAFRTFALPKRSPPCPNDGFRGGPSVELPDCRAYEIVSPLDKGNTDIGLLREGRYTELNKAATSGDLFTFSSIAAFGKLEGGAYISQYLAKRGPAGWLSETISPPRTTPPLDGEVGLTNEFKGFTADLCQGWLRHNSAARLTSDAVLEYPNIYRRHNCTEPPAYEAITTEKPKSRPPDKYSNLQLKGFSEDGTHTIYVADEKLHKDAPPVGADELLLYEHVPGETRFVCYLPNGKVTKPCGAGTIGSTGPDFSTLHNAISDDGSHIFWTAFSGTFNLKFAQPGRIYVRIDGKETVAVSPSVSLDPAFFWTASADGSKVVFEFVEGPLSGNLYEFDVATETPRLIAEEVEGPMGASEDASKLYFASGADLDGDGPAGDNAHNLYLYESASGGDPANVTFIMELADEDIGTLTGVRVTGPQRPIHRQPAGRGAAVSPDGIHATFMSAATPPDGYDHLDVMGGAPATEVYRYDAASDDLRCVSCNPTGARPSGVQLSGSWVVARLQGWEMHLHSPHVLSADGQRVFFESHEALVPTDTNGAWDVYQWEAPGKGTCSTDDPTYGTDAGGCVELISSGRSPADSTFLDADPSGNSAFIATQASLIGSDYGLNDVYVARVEGGFPEPKTPGECEGEACQSPPPAPPTTTPGSFSHQGPPDPKAKPRRRCPKGKRRVKRAGKVRCVPKKRGKKGKGKAARKRSSTPRVAR